VLHPVELLDASLRGMPTAMVHSAGHR
jgi:hypothetical protein